LRIADLKIEDVAFGGHGVARDHGKAVFVPFTIDGELVSAQIVHEKKRFTEAELIEVREASSHRTQPQCPYFGRCGGCSYQHIDYEHQLTIKWHQVKAILRRIGKMRDVPMRPMVSSPHFYSYRNRITVHAAQGIVGFFRRDGHRLIDVEKCPIALPEVNNELAALRARRPQDGHYTLRAKSGPRVFSQTNDAVGHYLLEHAIKLTTENGVLLIDAYCGGGFFAKHLLKRFERVIGIDWDIHAIRAAKQNATAKEDYYSGNVDELLGEILRKSDPRSTTVLVDPPAIGLSRNVRRILVEYSPSSLIYVSCNPPTLARDLAEFRQRFAVDSITAFDMFPQTSEIEVVAHLRPQSRMEVDNHGASLEKNASTIANHGNA